MTHRAKGATAMAGNLELRMMTLETGKTSNLAVAISRALMTQSKKTILSMPILQRIQVLKAENLNAILLKTFHLDSYDHLLVEV